eukprot:TRINITY_DN4720_c0_g2_i1.p1 TRINITY_DN4720_c0_g2~~TRINITY_DN4720_c0_g2_i1.p1  ORF type:complete len:512 (+),score=112.06 TRINITY_DN4720_c0_g2_i1:163-1698(+)
MDSSSTTISLQVKTSSPRSDQTPSINCRECGTLTKGKYCSYCGSPTVTLAGNTLASQGKSASMPILNEKEKEVTPTNLSSSTDEPKKSASLINIKLSESKTPTTSEPSAEQVKSPKSGNSLKKGFGSFFSKFRSSYDGEDRTLIHSSGSSSSSRSSVISDVAPTSRPGSFENGSGDESRDLQIKILDVFSAQSTSQDRKFLMYVLNIKRGPDQWQAYRRYSQFKALNQKLTSKFGDSCEALSAFPPSRKIGRFSENFMIKRVKLLQEYLDKIINQPIVAQSTEFSEFLDISNDEQLSIISSMWSNPQKEGQLTKKGHFRKNWTTRWFILQNSMLFYFKAKPSKSNLPQGFLPLGYCTVEIANYPTRKFCFQVINSQWNDEKDFIIQASSESEMQEWILAIRNAKSKAYSHLASVEDIQPATEKKAALTEEEIYQKNSHRLKNYLDSTRGPKKVSDLKAKFDIMAFAKERDDFSFITEKDSDDNIRIHNDPEKKIKIKAGTVKNLIVKMVDT